MKRFVRPLILILSISCSACALTGNSEPAKVVVAADSLCTATTRYHASDEQKAAFLADKKTWESLARWLGSFNKVRDERCN